MVVINKQHVALVTGGGRGLGRGISLRIASGGCDVAVTGPDLDELEATVEDLRRRGNRALPIVLDVTDEQQVKQAVAEIRQEFGPIDVLINNAGIAGPTAPIQDVSTADWNEVLNVNLTGAFYCSRAVASDMIELGRGKIINISSVAGKIGYPLRIPYAVSKWGLIGLSQSLAKELGPHNIQVNAICPGPIEGERMENVIKERAAQLNQSVRKVRKTYLETMALGRMVTENDVAQMVGYLVSIYGDNITGQAIDVSAGYRL